MDTPRNFRSAFHGFNREDVVHYLEFINARHAAQINQLTTELEELRAVQVPAVDQDQLEDLQTRCDRLTLQLEVAEAANAELQARCDALENREEPPAAAPAEENTELETYRRAERTEREARDRAELVYFQANSVLNEATAKVENIAAEITEMADGVMSQLTQLQVAVSGSKHTLQDAAAIMHSIRPNHNR